MFLENRNRKWIISYDLTIDGQKQEDLELTLPAANNIVNAVTSALDQIYHITMMQAPDAKDIHTDIWDVCEVEE